MRVFVVHNAYQQPGGEDEVFRAEVELLRKFGVEVSSRLVSNDEVASLGSVPLGLKTVWNRDEASKLRDVFREFRPDVVHFHNTLPLVSPAAYYAAKSTGAAVVQTLHNYRFICPAATLFREGAPCELCVGRPVPWPGVKHACYRGNRAASGAVATMLTFHRAVGTYRNKVDRYIALSEFARSKFIEGGLQAEKIAVKPNFVGEDPGVGTVDGGYALFVGRLSQEKGISMLIEAWKAVGERLPLQIVGDGPLMGEVRAKASSVAGVTVIGRLSRADVAERMRGARLLVFPSICYETFGMVAIEAFAAGIPVVASRLGSMAEIVDDGRTGLHFKPGDADDLARKVLWLVQRPEEVKRMRVEARQEFLAKYTAERNYEAISAVYVEAIRESKSKLRVADNPATGSG